MAQPPVCSVQLATTHLTQCLSADVCIGGTNVFKEPSCLFSGLLQFCVLWRECAQALLGDLEGPFPGGLSRQSLFAWPGDRHPSRPGWYCWNWSQCLKSSSHLFLSQGGDFHHTLASFGTPRSSTEAPPVALTTTNYVR